MIYSGQHVVVLGLGHSGEAAARLLHEEGARVTVCESMDTPVMRAKAESLRSAGWDILLGEAADGDPRSYDVCVLSPGIDPAVPLVRNVVGKGIPIIGELELAFEECLCPVVAITGTNGKTTTTELTTAMLKGAGVKTMASGNIGLPFSTAVRESDALDVMILEVSSFQLETIRHFRPRISAWLNLSPNHLDRYSSMEEYRMAKLRIFENQTSGDVAVINSRCQLPALAARTITFSANDPSADFSLMQGTIAYHGGTVLDPRDTLLRGVHNAENIMAALGIGLALGVDLPKLVEAIGDHRPPAHRCEHVRELGGIAWVNDSKSTNLDSVEKAILSQERPIVLIAGGKDKGFGFDDLLPLVSERTRAAILIGEMRERIARSWKGVDCTLADSLEEAVLLARRAARPGDVVLFSPGTSSFDMFQNYGERGNRFKAAVAALSESESTTP